jgi:GT2 family glycosyltransferase
VVAYESPASVFGLADEHAPSRSTPQAPSVVLVMVTRNPGPWFEDVLQGIAHQDYPNLSVLVIDAASERDPLPTVARLLPAAYVRRLEGNPGFGVAANEVLGRVSGAAFFAFCHDDVLLEPDAVRTLVEEAYRSDAGVVGPKIVSWGNRLRLLQVGMSADKTGVVSPLVDRGELDQEQHDRVRDVFVIPGACTVVRAELFESLEGFDPGITFLGEDLDLCWRAQVAGSRVVVVPAARVEHLEALDARSRTTDAEAVRRRLTARHRLRTMLTCYGIVHLLRVLPQAAFVTLVELVHALATGRLGQARDVVGAWWWNVRRAGDLFRRRRKLRRVRAFPDREVRRLQSRGSALLNAFVRGELHKGEHLRSSLADVGRGLSGSLVGDRRATVGTWCLILLFVVFGGRQLLAGHLPAVGSLAPVAGGPLSLLGDYVSGWRAGGLGSEAPSPTAVGILGLLGLPFLGRMGALQVVLVLGTLPLGLAGAWRLAGVARSFNARIAAVVVYAAVPLPYAALGQGRWAALTLYAAAPWILFHLGRAVGDRPFPGGADADDDDDADDPDVPAVDRPVWQIGLAVALPTALVAALVPGAVLVVVLAAVGLLLGTLLTGNAAGGLRALQVAGIGAAVALGLHLPWALDLLLPGSSWSALAGVEPLGTPRLAITDLLRFGTQPGATPLLSWLVPAVGLVGLLVGRDWRLAWAGRAWMVALVCWVVVWSGGQGVLPVPLPTPELLLAPAAAAMALAAAMAVAAVERDVRASRLDVSRVAGTLLVASLVLAAVPALLGTVNGRFGAPDADFARSLTIFDADEVRQGGTYRVLWLGHPDVLPLGSHRLTDDLAYGVSIDGAPTFTELWPGREDAGNALVADALRLASDGQTQRLGRLLAPLGIRFLAMPEQAVPARAAGEVHPLPVGARRAVDAQLDLRRIDIDPAVHLYENAAFAPVAAQVGDEDAAETVATAGSLFGPALGLDLRGAEPVLEDGTARRRTGTVEPGLLYVAEAFSSRWQLTVDGRVVEGEQAMGWANRFRIDQGGAAELRYRASPLRWAAVLFQVVLWVAVLVLRASRRRAAEGRRPPPARRSAATPSRPGEPTFAFMPPTAGTTRARR